MDNEWSREGVKKKPKLEARHYIFEEWQQFLTEEQKKIMKLCKAANDEKKRIDASAETAGNKEVKEEDPDEGAGNQFLHSRKTKKKKD